MPKKTKTVRSARALVGGLYPTTSSSRLPAEGAAQRLLLWAHEDGELLDRRLVRCDEDEHSSVLSAVERFRARDGSLPERVVLNSKRLLELSREALGGTMPCDEGETPQTDRAAAALVGGLLPTILTPVFHSPGVDADASVDVLSCFFDHARALFERCPWRALHDRFCLMRVDLGNLGWPMAVLEIRRGEKEGAGLVLHRSLYDWRRAQRLRGAGLEDAIHPERLELRRIPRRQLEPRLRALMEEFDWLAPVSLQPAPIATTAKGEPRPPTAVELQLLSAAAIVVERILQLEETRSEAEPPGFLEATVAIEDELWHAEVEVAAPPAALRGVQLHPAGDPTLKHILQCFACTLAEDDHGALEFLQGFQQFAADSYRTAMAMDRSEVEDVLGVELLLVYLAPYLATRYLVADCEDPDGFAPALQLCGRLGEWLARSRLIDAYTQEELHSLFVTRASELLRAAEVAQSSSEQPADPREPFLRARLELIRLAEGRAWFRGIDGRCWGPIAAARANWLSRVERGWRLDLLLQRNRRKLVVDRLMAIYPRGIAPLRGESLPETGL